MDGFKNLILGWILQMLNGFDANVNNVVTILSKDIFTGSMYTLAQNISDVVTPIALDIIGICFLIEFLKISVRMNILKWEYALTVFFKLVFAKAVIDGSFQLLSAIYATGAEWITKIGVTGSTLGDTVSVAIQNQIKNMGFWEVLGLLISMGVVFLAIWVAGMIVQVVAYGRMFELLVYLAIAPLPCAFLPLENSRITKKYFLAFAGVCLQGVFMVISIKLYSALCSDTLLAAVSKSSNVTDIAYNLLIGALVLVMAVIKSGQWAKNVLDAA